MSYSIVPWKRSRFWAVLDPAGALVAVVVYRTGARALVARLAGGAA